MTNRKTRMKRQTRWLLLVVVMALVAAACGGDDDTSDAGGSTETTATGVSQAPTTLPPDAGCFIEVEEDALIVFSGWGDETEQQVYRDSIERFSALCPAVTIDYQPIPADFQTKMKASMAGGTAPDVFYVDDQLMTAFGPTGQLLALNDAMAKVGTSADDFIPALMPIFTLDGSIYALPKDWGTLGLVYLPAAFAEAGIDEPTGDWTWEDLKTASQTIADTTEYDGFCQGADWARFAPWAFGNGGSFTSDDFKTATLDTAEVKEAATFIFDMKESGALVEAADVGAGWCGEAIGKELVGLTYEGGWMVNYLKTDFPDVEWKAVPLPSGPVGKADIIFTNGIGVNAGTDYPLASTAFTIFLTGAANQGEIVATGFAYSTHPEQIDLVVNENDAAIAVGGTFPLSKVAYWGPTTGRVNDTISQAFARIYLHDQTVDEAFDQAQVEAQTALDEG